MFSKILVPVDGSKVAEKALEYASHLARQNNSEIHLIHVSPAGWIVGDAATFGGYPIPQSVLDSEMESQKVYLSQLRATLEKDNIKVVSHWTQGDAATEVLALAEAEGCSLIILTSHGRSGLSRFLIGSVAERITRHSCCPVMVVGRTSMKAQDAFAKLV